MNAGMIFGEAFGGLALMMSTAYPIFLFVWFGRRKVKADMAAW